MIILGIDPGNHCGWALRLADGRMLAGVWYLNTRREEGPGMRQLRLRARLRDLLQQEAVDLVAWEEVRRHAGTQAAHVYGALTGLLAEECEARGLRYTTVPVATVKRLATGKGNADKSAMVTAAARKWSLREDLLAEDEADARWIAEAAAAEYGG